MTLIGWHFGTDIDGDPAKARRFNTGWLNIVDADWKRSQDKKFRLELEELVYNTV